MNNITMGFSREKHIILRRILALVMLGIGLFDVYYIHELFDTASYVYILVLLPLAGSVCLLLSGFYLRLEGALWREAALFVGAVLGFGLLELMTGNWKTITENNYFYNVLLIYILFQAFMVFINRPGIAIGIGLVLCMICGAAFYYVMLFRGTPLVPWDLYALETAATVAGAYTFSATYDIICAVNILILTETLLFGMEFIRGEERKIVPRFFRAGWTLCCALFFGYVIYPALNASLWDAASLYREQGSVSSFVVYTQYVKSGEPEGYSEEICEDILGSTKNIEAGNIQAENVIIIMNESFADMRVINSDIIGDDYMANIDGLTENVVKGNLVSPVFGARTCDVEFEVLTGVSTRYTSSLPYITAVNGEVDSIASYLQDSNFATAAFHPYHGANWKRNVVYPLLGFQHFYDLASMPEYEMVRCYIADKSNNEKVIEIYEENEQNGDAPLFLFNVTIQNHGGYEERYENFPINVDLSAYGDYPKAETYLELVRESDEQFMSLIEYFSNVDEPTLICFFGDHMATLEDSFYELLYGKKLSELTPEENILQYVTPFVIWTNYDIKEEEMGMLSSNFLESLILKYGGFELEGFEAFSYQVAQQYPVISLGGIFDSEGKYYSSEEEADDTLLQEYEYLQYYRMN